MKVSKKATIRVISVRKHFESGYYLHVVRTRSSRHSEKDRVRSGKIGIPLLDPLAESLTSKAVDRVCQCSSDGLSHDCQDHDGKREQGRCKK